VEAAAAVKAIAVATQVQQAQPIKVLQAVTANFLAATVEQPAVVVVRLLLALTRQVAALHLAAQVVRAYQLQ
jgi:hypothetical protein